MRSAWTPAATTAASDANRCTARIQRPAHGWASIRATDAYGDPSR
jgi:hypothetical protein